MNKGQTFVVLLLLGAAMVTYWSVQTIPHHVIVHLNDTWHIMLVGEQRIDRVDFFADDFVIEKQDQANLWLSGQGQLKWQQHTLAIKSRDTLLLNDREITRSRDSLAFQLQLYPDGRVTKGKATLHFTSTPN